MTDLSGRRPAAITLSTSELLMTSPALPKAVMRSIWRRDIFRGSGLMDSLIVPSQ